VGRGWALVVAMALGCGPRVDPGADGATDGASSSTAESRGSTASSGSGGDDATVGTATVTSSSDGSTSTSDGEASSGDASSTGAPEVIELEGLIEACAGCFIPLALRPCADPASMHALGGNVLDLWACTGTYAKVRGYFLDCPGGPCSEEVFFVEEAIETRLCEASDCGGTSCGAVDCVNTCDENWACPLDQKCVPWAPPGLPYAARRCVEVAPDPVGVGEACQEDAAQPWVDDCDATSVCMDVDPTTSLGVCTAMCNDDDDECGSGESCVRTNEQVVHVCLPRCDPFADACPSGSTCEELNGSVVCVDDDELTLLTEYPCEDAIQCDSASLCADPSYVPECAFDDCCTPLCDLLAPACPVGTACAPYDEPPAPTQENLGVCVAG
jgi:hypothetical protein